MDYIAILGNTPELSALELGVSYNGGQVAVLPTVPDLTKLGGVVKVAEHWTTLPWSGDTLPDEVTQEIFFDLQSKTGNGKLQFGFSLYAGDDNISQSTIKRVAKHLQHVGIKWKQTIKHSGHMVRFVTSKEPALSSVIVTREHLLPRQTDYVLVFYEHEIKLGRTTAVQDYRAFSERDYGRPGRDHWSGMMPPKVARMLVNIAQPKSDSLILDPFCGSGTIVQEALLLGYKNVIGSDISPTAMAATKENLEWLKLTPKKLFQADARDLLHHLKPHSIDCIVAEGYLGPVRPNQTERIQEQMIELYSETFHILAQLLKPTGRLVFALPAWRQGQHIQTLPLNILLPKTAFTLLAEPVLYGREQASVLRHIVVATTKSQK